jgi:biopolymer transport protein ExbD
MRRIDDKIIPMINIIFLLLLFFIIAGSLSELVREDIVPPRSGSSEVGAGLDEEWLLGADGNVVWQGRAMSVAALREYLRQNPQQLPRHVRLRADSKARAMNLVPLLEVLENHGVARLALVAINDGQGR